MNFPVSMLSRVAELLDEALFCTPTFSHITVGELGGHIRFRLHCEAESGARFDARVIFPVGEPFDAGAVVKIEPLDPPRTVYHPLDPEQREAFLPWWTQHFPSAVNRHKYFSRHKDRFAGLLEPLLPDLPDPHEDDHDELPL